MKFDLDAVRDIHILQDQVAKKESQQLYSCLARVKKHSDNKPVFDFDKGYS